MGEQLKTAISSRFAKGDGVQVMFRQGSALNIKSIDCCQPQMYAKWSTPDGARLKKNCEKSSPNKPLASCSQPECARAGESTEHGRQATTQNKDIRAAQRVRIYLTKKSFEVTN